MYSSNGKGDFAQDTIDCSSPNGHGSRVYENILETIGNTPLVKLNRIPKDHGLECEIFAKCEFMNPGGSIKDRIAATMLTDAEKTGRARPGSRFVEPTSGNTGIGVSLVTAVKGYGCTIVTPDKNSEEKMSTISLLGADIVQTPSVAPYGDPENFAEVTKKILSEDPNNICTDQYANLVNPITHYKCTAEEILTALGHVDMAVIGAGTGGTVTGIARKLKERCPKCIVVVVDPKGSTIFGEGESKQFLVEGIGGDFVPDVLEKDLIDNVQAPDDRESFNMAREVIRREGLLCGGSSGAVMVGAIKAAKELNIGAGKRVVVIFADGIRNYMTKFVCDQWMEAHLFKEPPLHDFEWWNQPLSMLEFDSTVPQVHLDKSCQIALALMGTTYSVAIVVDDNGWFKGAFTKDWLRHNVTNPKKSGEFDLRDPVKKHLMKYCYKIIENRGQPTIGLVSRMLDITSFVVKVKEHESSIDHYVPLGIITPERVLQHIINSQL